MCMPPYSLLPNGSQNRFLLSLHSSLLQKSLHSGGLQLPSPPLGLKSYFRPLRGESIWLDHFFWPPPINDPDTPTLLHRSSGSRSSPDISFAPSTLAFSCSWEVLQDLGSDHLPILLSIPLSPVFRPNQRPPSFNFHKARWNGFASYFDSHCPSAEEYSSLSLPSAAALFTSLTLNAAKFSIPFGGIKRPPKAWWSAEVEQAVSDRRKAFAAAHRSDEDRQAYISASRRASSVIAKAKTEAWQTTCSSLSPKSNPKSVHSLFRSIAGSSLTHRFPRFPPRNLCSLCPLSSSLQRTQPSFRFLSLYDWHNWEPFLQRLWTPVPGHLSSHSALSSYGLFAPLTLWRLSDSVRPLVQTLGSCPASGAPWSSAMPPFLGRGRVTNNINKLARKYVYNRKKHSYAKSLLRIA